MPLQGFRGYHGPRPQPIPKRRAPRPARKPVGVFKQPVRAPSFKPAQRQARQHVEHARSRLPQQRVRLPQPPVLRHPTAAQRQLAKAQQVRAVNRRRLPGETAAEAKGRLLRAGTGQQRTQVHRLSNELRREARLPSAQLAFALRSATRSQLRPGPRRSAGSRLISPFASAATFLASPEHNAFVAAAPALKLPGAVLREAIDLPRNTVLSTYYLGAGLAEAARGRPQRLKQLGHDFVNTDPLALVAQGRFREAGQQAMSHPLSTTLELAGVRAVPRSLGRLAGSDLRGAPRVVPGTALGRPTIYRSPVSKAVGEARRGRLRESVRRDMEEARRALARGDEEAAQRLQARAARRNPDVMTAGQVQHVADVREGLGQPARRRGRAEVTRRMRPLEVSAREGGHLQRLLVEGTIAPKRLASGEVDVRAIRSDLEHYRGQLAREAGNLRGSRLHANKATQRRVGQILAQPDAQLAQVAERARVAAHETNRLEAPLIERGMLDAREAKTAAAKSYAVRHMGARVQAPAEGLARYERELADARALGLKAPARPKERLVDAEGRPLSVEQVHAHMRAHGVDPQDIAFVSQAPRSASGMYNVRWFPRKGASRTPRTGTAVLQGLVDTHPRNLTANAVRLQQLVEADRNFVRGVREVAARDPRNPRDMLTFGSKGEADAFADRLRFDRNGEPIPGAPHFRAVRLNPYGGRESQLQHLLDQGDLEGFVGTEAGGLAHPISEAIHEAVTAKGGEGPWAVVPDAWARRIADHALVYQSSPPTLRAINGFFRQTVLPLSASWLTGNVTEAALRSVVKSPRVLHNLLTYRRVMRVLERVDPEAAAQVKDALGTGNFGMMEQGHVYTSLEQFTGAKMEPVVRALARVRRTPGPGTVADAYRKYTQFVFNGINDALERPFRETMAGHYIRRNLMPRGSVLNMGRAVEQAAEGLRNTPEMVRMADDVRRAYGQYEAFGPQMRKVITLYSPFVPWSINAVRFLADVLPRDHPALTALLAAESHATEKMRQQAGMDEWLAGHVPAFLLGSIPTAGGGHVRVARYTPFGFAGDPAGSVAGLVLPQFEGPQMALNGLDWTGRPLKGPNGGDPTTSQKFGAAGASLAEGLIPFVGLVRRALGYEGSVPSRILQTQNPFRVVAKKKKAARSGGGWDFGGSSSSRSSSGGGWDFGGASSSSSSSSSGWDFGD